MAETRAVRRRRPRRGTLERPVSGRIYRGTWLLLGVPLLVAAFSVGRPAPLPAPPLPPTFDGAAARALAGELAGRYPDRSPGSPGAARAAAWVSARLSEYGYSVERRTFEQTIPDRGRVRLTNLVAVSPGASNDAIVVMAHRDDTGVGAGADDNASGTGTLIELARAYAPAPAATGREQASSGPRHEIVFLSTDGGAAGAAGAARFAGESAYRGRLLAVINLDTVGGEGRPGLELGGDAPRSPPPALAETAAARLAEQTGQEPSWPSPLRQLLDLGFPFSLSEQAPFLAAGVPAVTLTRGGNRPPAAFSDSVDRLGGGERLESLGRSAQALIGSLDTGELSPSTAGAVYLGRRFVPGWAVQLVLVAALAPFLAAVVDLFARCRRRRLALAGAAASLAWRLGFWLVPALLFGLLALLGAWPSGSGRPLAPESMAATHWPLAGLTVLAVGSVVAWLAARERLIPRSETASAEELAGYTVALLALAVLALVVVVTNAYALVYLLPSLHAWLWLPQVRRRSTALRLGVLAAGLAGPLALFASFAGGLELGLDAPWYLAALVAVGYVSPPAVLLALVWLAPGAQLAALAVHRYAPYRTPSRERGAGLRRLAGTLHFRRQAVEAPRAVEGS